MTDISSQLGLTGISTDPFDYGLPSINFTNFTGLSDPNPSLNRSQTYRYVDNLRWMKDKHTISIGGEIRKMDINRDTDPAPNGQFSFTGLMTSQLTSAGTPVASPANCVPATPSVPCIGSDFADFLLGYPANTKVQFGDTSTYFRNWGFVGYATDDWHMFPQFTVTYGVAVRGLHAAHGNQRPHRESRSQSGLHHGAMRHAGRHRKLRRRELRVAVQRPLQQLGAAHRHCLAASGEMVFRKPSDDDSRRVQHVLRRVLLEHAGKRDGQPASVCHGEYPDDARRREPAANVSEWLVGGARPPR